MKKILLSFVMFITLQANAQHIKATVNDMFQIRSNYTFNNGDTVDIHAYKKNKDVFYFIVETEEYADIIKCHTIPFAVEEKQLKKLPNALSEEMNLLLKQKKEEVLRRIKNKWKNKALNGEIKGIISNTFSLTPTYGDEGKLSNGETVTIIGYKYEGGVYHYALYSDHAAGVFSTSSRRGVFSNDLNTKNLPSIEDPDVKNILVQKKEELLKQIIANKAEYKKKALAGEIKGIISYPYLTSDNGSEVPFNIGDTVSVVGYSIKNRKCYYALYSNKGVGFYNSSSPESSSFSNYNNIDFELLPPYDDPDVKAEIKKQSIIVDSIRKIENEKLLKELIEAKQDLIALYKQNEPVIVKLDSWNSNSVGGIEVSISVTNCSSQTIKYITFQGYFTNAVGDKCHNEIGGGVTWKGRGVGPIGPRPTTLENFDERIENNKGSYTFDNLTFYSRTAQYFHFSSLTIQYMNGKTITISGANLEKHVRYE